METSDLPPREQLRLVDAAYFDRTLKQVKYRDDADGWLEVVLLHPYGQRKEAFYEVRTRFILVAAGRGRPKSLTPARKAVATQRRMGKERGIPLRAGTRGRAPVPLIVPQPRDGFRLKILDQQFFQFVDARLEPTSAREADVAVALVHTEDLPSDFHCRIRTRHAIIGARRALRDLAVCTTIADLQRGWKSRFGSHFAAYGRVQPYVYSLNGAATLTPIRGYGARSLAALREEAAFLFLAVDIVEAAWRRYLENPQGALLAFHGVDLLVAALTVVGAIESAVVESRSAGRLSDSEVTKARRAIRDGAFPQLPAHIRNAILTGAGVSPSATEQRPSAPEVVLDMILRFFPTDALTRFAPPRGTGPTGRAPLTPEFVEHVGRTMGLHGRRLAPAKTAYTQGARVSAIVTDLLVARHGKNRRTLLDTVVQPILRGDPSTVGFLVMTDKPK